MKYLKSYKLFELHRDTYSDALDKIRRSGDIERAINFRNTYKEMSGEILDGEFSDDDYRNIVAIANEMDIDLSETEVEKSNYSHYGMNLYEFKEPDETRSFAIGTDEQATNAANEYIDDAVWSFRTGWLLNYISLEDAINELGIETTYMDEIENDEGEYEEEEIEMDEEEAFEFSMGMDLESYIKSLQEKCESGNEDIKSLIGDLDEFKEDSISADGRGHFITSYDGIEHGTDVNGETLYIYRTD